MNFKNPAYLISALYESASTYYSKEWKKNLNIDDMLKTLKTYFLSQKEFMILIIDEFDQMFLKSSFQTQLSFKLMELA